MKVGILFIITALLPVLASCHRAGEVPSQEQTPPSTAQQTPILNTQKVGGGFCRYIPDAKGDIEWKMRGASARFLTPQLIEIIDLVATPYDREIGDLVIKVDKVIYDMETREARADESRVSVRRENMLLTGRGLLWTPQQQQIRVLEDVKLLIKEQDNQGLFPL